MADEAEDLDRVPPVIPINGHSSFERRIKDIEWNLSLLFEAVREQGRALAEIQRSMADIRDSMMALSEAFMVVNAKLDALGSK